MEERNVGPEWVDYPTAERYSGLSHTTLWRYVSSGSIKAARVGRSVRINLPALRSFMEERASGRPVERPATAAANDSRLGRTHHE